jgi:hypothetical protein
VRCDRIRRSAGAKLARTIAELTPPDPQPLRETPLGPASITASHDASGPLRRATRAESVRRAFTEPPAGIRPASDFVPYPEFEALVRDAVARIPDLAPYWSLRAKKPRAPDQDLYVFGGLLRGAISWVIRNLQTRTPEEIRALPIPRSLELLSQPADRDLLVLDSSADEKVRRVLAEPGTGWELVDPWFYRASVKVGGSAIEKTAVNPERILDPQGGLRDLWRGKASRGPRSRSGSSGTSPISRAHTPTPRASSPRARSSAARVGSSARARPRSTSSKSRCGSSFTRTATIPSAC